MYPPIRSMQLNLTPSDLINFIRSMQLHQISSTSSDLCNFIRSMQPNLTSSDLCNLISPYQICQSRLSDVIWLLRLIKTLEFHDTLLYFYLRWSKYYSILNKYDRFLLIFCRPPCAPASPSRGAIAPQGDCLNLINSILPHQIYLSSSSPSDLINLIWPPSDLINFMCPIRSHQTSCNPIRSHQLHVPPIRSI